jgi:RNA polymerase sigma factor (sigma-70 family)
LELETEESSKAFSSMVGLVSQLQTIKLQNQDRSPVIKKTDRYLKLSIPTYHLVFRKPLNLLKNERNVRKMAIMHAETLLDIAMMHSDTLILKAKQGDQNAQGKLVQLWYKRIYNFGFKFFLDHDMAMEVSQKTFISMCKNLVSLQDTARFKAWLYKIAVNYCREEVRKTKNNRSLSFDTIWNREAEDSPRWESSGQRNDNPERQLQQAELSDILQEALLELNDDQREVVIMKEFEGLKFREIADVLNISENTVKSRMYYGLDGLRKILEKKNINKDTIGYEL